MSAPADRGYGSRSPGAMGRRSRETPIVQSPTGVAVAGLAALAVAMGIGRFAFTPILPMMQADAGLSVAEGGYLASANYVGYLIGAVSAIAIKIRLTIAIRAGLALIGAVTLAMGFEHRIAGWVAVRALAGIGSAWVLISVSAWCLGKLAPLRRPVLNSAVFAGVGAGIAVAGGYCVVLMEEKASSAHAWVGLGLLSLIVTALTWPVFRGDDDAAPVPSGRTTGRGFSPDFLRLVLCYGAFGFGYIIPATFLPVMAREAIRDPLIFGWSWPIFGVAAAASTFAAAGLVTVFGNRRLWSLTHLVMALGVVLPVVWPGIAGIMVAALFVGGTFMVTTMTGMQEARLVAVGQPTGLMAAMTSAFAAGQIAGPLFVSYLVGAGRGFAEALVVAAIVLTASAWALSRSSRP
jgi:predicted MFS family arabinose efflux permease